MIGTQETVGRYKADVVKSIGTRADEATIANHLYAVLREFDDAEVEYIYSESFAAGGIGSAIMNLYVVQIKSDVCRILKNLINMS